MFGKPTNPYDEIINKATDEKQTEINWETALTVWDKVNEDGETGARNSVNALTKRLTHRSANVQLFALTLAGALVNNCGPSLHREISGKAFTQALTRLINDRTTHESVKKEALKSIEEWVKEHENNSDFDLLNDTYQALKRQNHKFPSSATRNPSPPRINDDALRREEEDLQRALAESAALSNPLRNGYQPSSSLANHTNDDPSGNPSKSLPSEPAVESTTMTPGGRVRALYDFVGQSREELELKRGDVVEVVECLYQDWWKGKDRFGRVGIFPRNHVEVLPEEDRNASASQPGSRGREGGAGASSEEDDLEAEVFAQVAVVDRLLDLMHRLRAQGQDFADNDELTDLYNSSMRLRPRVVRLIRKYDQKQADLENMNRKVDQARGIYERMMTPQQHLPQGTPQGYPQAQTNGYHSQFPHGEQQQPDHRAFSPAAAAGAHGQFPPQGQIPAAVDPNAIAAIEEQQRREYEHKWAEYERQMEEYNRQVAAHQQYHQSTGQTPQGQAPEQGGGASGGGEMYDPQQQQQRAQAHHPVVASPVPSLSRSQTSVSAHQPVAPPAQQPVWDGQAWVWPTQVAQVAAHPPPFPATPSTSSVAESAGSPSSFSTAAPPGSVAQYPHHPAAAASPRAAPAHSPSLSTSSQPPHHHQQQFASISSPPPNVALYSTPPTTSSSSNLTNNPNPGSAAMMGHLTDGVANIELAGQAQQGGGVAACHQQSPLPHESYHSFPQTTAQGAYYAPQEGDPAQAQWAGSGR